MRMSPEVLSKVLSKKRRLLLFSSSQACYPVIMGDYICFTWFLLNKPILADSHFFVICQEDYLIIIYKLLKYFLKEESVYIFTFF